VPLPAIFYYPPYRKNVYAARSNKVLIPSASPYLYVTELLKHHPCPERKGTIFFPGHSTGLINVNMDFNELAKGLTNLSAEYYPLTVCIYWKDFLLGHHVPFQKQGFQVVSAGHIFDPFFLFRLYHLFSMHKYTASNSLGSHLFYSVKSGCSYFFLLNEIEMQWSGDPKHLQQDIAPPSEKNWLYLRQLFQEPHPYPTKEQMGVADYHLGSQYLKSRHSLLMQLLYAELLDKCCFYTTDRDRAQRVFMPSYFRRNIYPLMHKTKHFVNRGLSKLVTLIRHH
jgi:hypothetical protein